MNLNNLCMGCMKEKPQQGMKCPYCGYDDTVQNNPSGMLPLWTVIKGAYVVGKVLGDGGFGITYTGFDLNLQKKIAIKEFFPYKRALRNEDQKSVSPVAGDEEFFYEERDRYVEEARILAQLDEQSGVVKVSSYFRENNTAYILMEFLEGVSLLDYVSGRGGKLAADDLLALMQPVVAALAGVHARGVIHKDISPDNIMVDAHDRAKLIDFGAAYDAHSDREELKVYKATYSPIEQIDEKGTVTTASDIYALCATMYFALTGTKPDSAIRRSAKDNMKYPSESGVDIEPLVEEALMMGFAVNPKERIQDANDLYYFLYQYGKENGASKADMRRKVRESSTKVILDRLTAEKKKERTKRNAITIGVVVLILGLSFILLKAIAYTKNHRTPVISVNTAESEQTKSGDKENHNLPDVSGWRDALYGKVSGERDETLENAANDMVAAFVTEDIATESEWNAYITKTVYETMTQYDLENTGWLVLPYHSDIDIDGIKKDADMRLKEINRGMEGAIDLDNAQRMGVSVGVHGDGTVFVVILYGE